MHTYPFARQNGPRSLACLVAVCVAGAACGVAPPSERTARSASALSTPDVLGFEAVSGWSATAGTVAAASIRTQGGASLSVSNVQYVNLTSVPLSTLSGATPKLAYDVMTPVLSPPAPFGMTQLFLSIPSQGVNNAFVGQVDLTTFTPGVFGTAQYTLPSTLVSKLSASYTDLTFSIVLNVPSGSGPYLLDNMRFIGDCVTPTAGMTITQSTTLCPGTYSMSVADGQAAVTVAANNVALNCNTAHLVGSGPGSVSNPNAGIRVGAFSAVTVSGCIASSFRFGLQATGAGNLTVSNSHFDANYNDPSLGFVDNGPQGVEGGGILFDTVGSGTVQGSTFANNWNGIDLRNSSNVSVIGNQGDHCANTGALLYGTGASLLDSNNFSHGVRGPGASTFDSASVLLDVGSSSNTIRNNDVSFGGDGVFVRPLHGCGYNNQIVNNQASFSPNNGIESECPFTVIQGNTANNNQYGLWLGGAFAPKIIGNTIENNNIDGISIQVWDDQHSVIQDNTVQNNGRAGILLSGLAFPAGEVLPTPDPGQTAPGNASQIIVQRNTLSANGAASLFTSDSALVTLASNCGLAPSVGADTTLVGPAFGTCGGASARVPPTAVVAVPAPSSIALGASATFDASGSAPSRAGGALRFTWLAHEAGLSFPTTPLPMPAFAGIGGSRQGVTFHAPGYYDVDVTVDDGVLAAGAFTSIAVLPPGTRFGNAASSWTFNCSLPTLQGNGSPQCPTVSQQSAPQCATTIADDPNGVEGTSVHVHTDDAFGFGMMTPAPIDASRLTTVGFFLRANNIANGTWQQFEVDLITATGTLRYLPGEPGGIRLLPIDPSGWVFISVPLTGGAGWTLCGQGALSGLQSVEIITDTLGFDAYDVSIDALSLY
jgi:parallel beta-helix repeat protein